ncbi:hypothetical protein KUTeg_023822 [Tegillarca granosa]|uniref:N-acetyltransferase domain-containing protein n=1 Tax=Tegillarca granosa TaxID=220873 RepID=A0ABQ9E7A1_TEGGR|nr:hypothetical protein KUTeg_023822 [Tegillarca granosa]
MATRLQGMRSLRNLFQKQLPLYSTPTASRTGTQIKRFSSDTQEDINYEIRPMRRSDIQGLYELLDENGWNMEKSYLECVFNTDPSGLVIVEKDDASVILLFLRCFSDAELGLLPLACSHTPFNWLHFRQWIARGNNEKRLFSEDPASPFSTEYLSIDCFPVFPLFSYKRPPTKSKTRDSIVIESRPPPLKFDTCKKLNLSVLVKWEEAKPLQRFELLEKIESLERKLMLKEIHDGKRNLLFYGKIKDKDIEQLKLKLDGVQQIEFTAVHRLRKPVITALRSLLGILQDIEKSFKFTHFTTKILLRVFTRIVRGTQQGERLTCFVPKVIDDSLCFCSSEEGTLQHLFFEYKYVHPYMEPIVWFIHTSGYFIGKITEEDIIFATMKLSLFEYLKERCNYYRKQNTDKVINIFYFKSKSHNGILAHSETIASSGMNIVKEDYRNHGIGKQLFRKVMDVMKDRNVGGTSLSNRITFYEQFGWTIKSYTIHYNQGRVNPNFIKDVPDANVEVVSVKDANFDDVISYDSELHTVPRPVYISNWALHTSATTYVALQSGRVCGYGVLRPADVGHKMYPLYANDSKIARSLFSKLASHIPEGEDLIFSQPVENEMANSFVEANNLNTYLSMTRLYNKWNIYPDLKRAGFQAYTIQKCQYQKIIKIT